jgi:hypothetical protein
MGQVLSPQRHHGAPTIVSMMVVASGRRMDVLLRTSLCPRIDNLTLAIVR